MPACRLGGAGETQHGVAAATCGLGGRRVALQQVDVGEYLTPPQAKRSLVQRAREADFAAGGGHVGTP